MCWSRKIADKKKIIMIMGMQRSGGSTLRRSFSVDSKLHVFRHGGDDAVYYHKRQHLRPEEELQPLFDRLPGSILLEPKSETKFRSVSAVLNEFSRYDVRILWNYRHPVEVFYSRLIRYPGKSWMRDELQFAELWSKRQRYILDAMSQFTDQITIVKMEDIHTDPGIYWKICRYLGLRGSYCFYRDSLPGHKYLPFSVRKRIADVTEEVFTELDRNRRFVPSFPRFLSPAYRQGIFISNRLGSFGRKIFYSGAL